MRNHTAPRDMFQVLTSAADAALHARCEAALTDRHVQLSHVAQVIDHSSIPTEDLAMALRNDAVAPWQTQYPWQASYPHAGQTVYCQGKLWLVAGREEGPCRDTPIGIVQLVGCGHDDRLTTLRYELRPASWTQRDEDWVGIE